MSIFARDDVNRADWLPFQDFSLALEDVGKAPWAKGHALRMGLVDRECPLEFQTAPAERLCQARRAGEDSSTAGSDAAAVQHALR